MTVTPDALRWNLDSMIPGLDSPEYSAAVSSLGVRLDALDAALGEKAGLEALLEAYNAASREASFLGTYTYCNVSADAGDARAQAA